MIPKWGSTNLWGVGLVGVLWKVISSIINFQLLSPIQLYDVLHGFRAGRGTCTATLEANLIQTLISNRETVLHSIFLDLYKSYGILDKELCLDILAGYCVGTSTIRIVQMYWSRIQMAAKAGGHYKPAFQSHYG